jgi:hypothetical protein
MRRWSDDEGDAEADERAGPATGAARREAAARGGARPASWQLPACAHAALARTPLQLRAFCSRAQRGAPRTHYPVPILPMFYNCATIYLYLYLYEYV